MWSWRCLWHIPRDSLNFATQKAQHYRRLCFIHLAVYAGGRPNRIEEETAKDKYFDGSGEASFHLTDEAGFFGVAIC